MCFVADVLPEASDRSFRRISVYLTGYRVSLGQVCLAEVYKCRRRINSQSASSPFGWTVGVERKDAFGQRSSGQSHWWLDRGNSQKLEPSSAAPRTKETPRLQPRPLEQHNLGGWTWGHRAASDSGRPWTGKAESRSLYAAPSARSWPRSKLLPTRQTGARFTFA